MPELVIYYSSACVTLALAKAANSSKFGDSEASTLG